MTIVIKKKTFQINDPEGNTAKELNFGNAFINYLNTKKRNFVVLINLIKNKYSNNNQFFHFFTFKMKIKNEESNIEKINYSIYFRFSNLSNKLELIFHDISNIHKIVSAKAQNKIKKKFMKKFSHEFRNPLLNIVQLIKNIKTSKTEERLNKVKSFNNSPKLDKRSTINRNKIFTSSIMNNNDMFANEIKKKDEKYSNCDLQDSDLEKTRVLNTIDFESIALFKNNMEIDNSFSKNSIKIGSISNKNSSSEKNENVFDNNFINNNENLNISPNQIIMVNNQITRKSQVKAYENNFNPNPIKDSFVINNDKCNINETINNINKIKTDKLHKNSSSIVINNQSILKRLRKDGKIYDTARDKDLQRQTSRDNISINVSNSREKNDLNDISNIEIFNLNHIKYTCYYLNYLISDFDTITNIDLCGYDNNNNTNNLEKQTLEKFDSFKLLEKNDVIYSTITSEINLTKLINKMIKIFRSKISLAEKKIKIIFEIDVNVPKIIRSSLEKITQILFNLFSNSLKFTKLGSIYMRVFFEHYINKLHFTISDTGMGIKKEFIKDIFKPFFKIKDNGNNIYGLGLGLFIVKLHIQSLNGEINVESKQNKFTKIDFYIITENQEFKNYLSNNDNSKVLLDSNKEKKIFFMSNKHSYEKKSNSNGTNLSKNNFKFSSSIKNYISNANEDKRKNKKSVISTRFNKLENTLPIRTDTLGYYNRHLLNNKLSDNENENTKNDKNLFKYKKCKTLLNDTKPSHLNIDNYKRMETIKLIDYKNNMVTSSSDISKISNFKSLFFLNKENSGDINLKRYLNNYPMDENDNKSGYLNFPTIIHERLIESNTDKDNRSFDNDLSFEKLNIINPRRNKSMYTKDIINYLKEIVIEKPKKIDERELSVLQIINNLKHKDDQFKYTDIARNSRYVKYSHRTPYKDLNNMGDANKSDLCLSKKTNKYDYDYVLNYSNYLANINNNNEFNTNIVYEIAKHNTFNIAQNEQISERSFIKKQTSPFNSKLNLNRKNSYGVNTLINDQQIYCNLDSGKKLPKICKTSDCFTNNKTEFVDCNLIRILVVDDEKLIRQSNSNMIKKFFKNKSFKYEVFECEDGFDCINYIYQALLSGINFDYIITDQTMNFISGTILSDIIGLLVENKIINEIKMFLLTSYSANNFNRKEDRFTKIFSKPLILEHLEFIFKDLYCY